MAKSKYNFDHTTVWLQDGTGQVETHGAKMLRACPIDPSLPDTSWEIRIFWGTKEHFTLATYKYRDKAVAEVHSFYTAREDGALQGFQFPADDWAATSPKSAGKDEFGGDPDFAEDEP